MSVRELSKNYSKPIEFYTGTEYYAQEHKYEQDPLSKLDPINLPIHTPPSLLPTNPHPQRLPIREKSMHNPRDLLQSEAQFPSSSTAFLFAPRILSADLIEFFAENPVSRRFHPYQEDSSQIHLHLQKAAAHFQELSKDLPLDEKLDLAEKIAIEIRNAKVIHFVDTKCKDLSLEEKIIAAEDAISDLSEKDVAANALYELGARYHLVSNLLKSEAYFPMSDLDNVGKIYQFMTLKNTYVHSDQCMRLLMSKNIIPSIAQTTASLWLPKSSLENNLLNAQESIASHIAHLKEMIGKGCIDTYAEEDERVFIEGDAVDENSEAPSSWNERDVENESINSVLANVESELRKAYAKQLVSSSAASYKATYTTTGAVPNEITHAIQEINAFANPPQASSMIAEITPGYNPARDLISGIFDQSSDVPTHLQHLKQEAHDAPKQEGLVTIFLRYLFPSYYASNTVQYKQNQERSIAWAQRQWNSIYPVQL